MKKSHFTDQQIAFAVQQAEASMVAQIDQNSLLIRPGDTILFQGDSITDGGRDRSILLANDPAALSTGFAGLGAVQILIDRPNDNLKIYNRGVGGNTIDDLINRWQVDCLDIKPNVLSILVGVNDVARIVRNTYKGDVNKFSIHLRKLLDWTRDTLPDVRIVICEPFVLSTGIIDESWKSECNKLRQVSRAIATEHNAKFVPFQEKFDAALKLAPPDQWAKDGIHPTEFGNALMAHWWLDAVST